MIKSKNFNSFDGDIPFQMSRFMSDNCLNKEDIINITQSGATYTLWYFTSITPNSNI